MTLVQSLLQCTSGRSIMSVLKGVPFCFIWVWLPLLAKAACVGNGKMCVLVKAAGVLAHGGSICVVCIT